jgi:hypothetical protein
MLIHAPKGLRRAAQDPRKIIVTAPHVEESPPAVTVPFAAEPPLAIEGQILAPLAGPVESIDATPRRADQEAKTGSPGALQEFTAPRIAARLEERRLETQEPPAGQSANSQKRPAPSQASRIPSEQSKDVHRVAPRVAPMEQAPPPALPRHAADRNRAQIAIGRIEVQVNNPPAPEPPAQPDSRSGQRPVHPHFLEARYLGRFALKP